MRKHGLPGISARNTAMVEAITDLPPIVVSDLFGVHPHTAYVWAQYAQNSWAEYLEAAVPGLPYVEASATPCASRACPRSTASSSPAANRSTAARVSLPSLPSAKARREYANRVSNLAQ